MTTTNPTRVKCDHCDASLTITPDLANQIGRIPAAGRMKAENRALTQGWMILPDLMSFCPATFDEMLAPADVDCPDWCTLPARHAFDTAGAGHPYRFHERTIGTVCKVSIDITSGESLVDGRAVVADKPHIIAYSDGSEEMSVRDALRLADVLRSAATQLSEIEAGRWKG